jgi:hypothetical protein
MGCIFYVLYEFEGKKLYGFDDWIIHRQNEMLMDNNHKQHRHQVTCLFWCDWPVSSGHPPSSILDPHGNG